MNDNYRFCISLEKRVAYDSGLNFFDEKQLPIFDLPKKEIINYLNSKLNVKKEHIYFVGPGKVVIK